MMHGWECRLRAGSELRHKPQVFLACHSSDYVLYLESTVQLLLEAFNCSVWFDEDASKDRESASSEEFEERLSRMQLIAVPVTETLLMTDNPIKEIIIPSAIRHGIPILPLMMEQELDPLYEQVFGSRHYLSPGADALPGAPPFMQLLQSYLEEIFLGDRLQREIREAFRASVFLSYRKKDRAYAKELIRKIHSEEKYRDVIIWYDAYLVPGNDFQASLLDEIDSCGLFLLSVTSSLTELPNYVHDTEYRKAIECCENGLIILPVETKSLSEEERKQLYMEYEDLPACVPEDDLLQNRQFLSIFSKGASELKQWDPRRQFLIGIAYQQGIDVEIDREFAKRAIACAAQAGSIEAAEYLVTMYREGVGTDIDMDEARRWRREELELRRMKWEQTAEQIDKDMYADRLWKVGDDYFSSGDLDNARKAYNRMLELSLDDAHAGQDRKLSIVYNRLGDLESAEGNETKALAYYQRCLQELEALIMYHGTSDVNEAYAADVCRDRIIVFNRIGEIALRQNRFNEAWTYFQNGMLQAQRLADQIGTPETRRDLMVCYYFYGSYEIARGNLKKARRHYQRMHELAETLERELMAVDAKRDLSISFERMADLAVRSAQYDEAVKNLHRAAQLQKEVFERTRDAEDQEAYENLNRRIRYYSSM